MYYMRSLYFPAKMNQYLVLAFTVLQNYKFINRENYMDWTISPPPPFLDNAIRTDRGKLKSIKSFFLTVKMVKGYHHCMSVCQYVSLWGKEGGGNLSKMQAVSVSDKNPDKMEVTQGIASLSPRCGWENRSLQSNLPHIYACKDLTSEQHHRILWCNGWNSIGVNKLICKTSERHV